VIGDEELALRSTAELATIAKKVYLVCNSDKALETPLGKKLQAANNVDVLRHYEVVDVTGDEYARALRVRDEKGKTFEYEADGMFVEKALTPNSEIAKYLVNLDDHGRIIVDGSNRTNVPGVFAAGDVTTDFAEQVLIAVGEGAKAALSAYEYLLPTL
jgi:thioredoxin reductase